MTADASELPLPERRRNIAMIVITVLPFVGLLLAVTMSWNEAVSLTDLLLFAGDYDGGHKGYVRWEDGSHDIVPGSRVERI